MSPPTLAARPDPAAMRAWLARHWPPLLLLSVLALLPFGRASELPMLIAAGVGLVWLLRGRLALDEPALRLAGVLWLVYWLPQLLSAFGAVAPGKAWTEVVADLRYLPFLYFAIGAQRSDGARRLVFGGAALIVLLWLLDALLQALTGLSLGGPADPERLSGIFGADDLKLGGVLAVLSPLLLLPALQRSRWLAAAALLALFAVVVLAGARAAWLMLALVLVLIAWSRLPRRQALAAISLAAVLALGGLLVAAQTSERVGARVERSAAALAGDPAALDHALSFRLPIWRAAWSMATAHPVNGVGVRGFRYAYAEHAPEDDRWRDFHQDQGAFHAHQIVLEILAETGLLGLAIWLAGVAWAWRCWRRAGPAPRAAASAVSIALVVMLFPLNTHYAIYSSVWGGLLFWLLALWLPALQPSPASGLLQERRMG
jgi:O-antigen ligase